jgi:hypothetical protein
MPIDTSIYQLAGRGVKSVADYDNEYSQGRQNKLQEALGATKLQDYQRGVERQNRLQGVLGQNYAAPEERETALLRGGFLEEATKLGKDRRDNAQTEANTKAKALETAHKRLEVVGQGLGWLKDNASPENAQSLIQHWVQTGVMSQQDAQQKMIEFQKDPTPQGIQKLALMGYQGALSAKDQLPKIETRSLGGTTDTFSINPITGAATTTNSVQNTESPDGRASRQVQLAQLAETKRHHGVTEGNQATTLAQGKIPPGYRAMPDGSLQAIPGGPADLRTNAAGVAKVSDAKDVLSLLDEVDTLLPKSTGSYTGVGVDAAASGLFGYSTEGAKTVAQLKALQGALVSKMPKMSGPQSDKDVQLYREMAGQVGDATVPIAQRQAASGIIRKLNEKYAGMPEGSSLKGRAAGGVIDFGDLK